MERETIRSRGCETDQDSIPQRRSDPPGRGRKISDGDITRVGPVMEEEEPAFGIVLDWRWIRLGPLCVPDDLPVPAGRTPCPVLKDDGGTFSAPVANGDPASPVQSNTGQRALSAVLSLTDSSRRLGSGFPARLRRSAGLASEDLEHDRTAGRTLALHGLATVLHHLFRSIGDRLPGLAFDAESFVHAISPGNPLDPTRTFRTLRALELSRQSARQQTPWPIQTQRRPDRNPAP